MIPQPPPRRLDASPSYGTGRLGRAVGSRQAVMAFSLPEMLEREPDRLNRHYHSFFQIMVLSGDAMIELDGRKSHVTTHSLALIYPSCVHQLTPSCPLAGTSISFSPQYFEQLLDEIGVCGTSFRRQADFPVLELEPLVAGQVNDTVATIQFEFDRSLLQRDLMIRECLKLLLIRASRLSE